MDNNEAYIALNLLPGIGPLRVNQLLTLFGEPREILKAPHGRLARVPGIGSRFADLLCNWQKHCDLPGELDMVKKGGVTIITREHECFPALLREIHDPPLCLYVRGDVQGLAELRAAIAIVGSRRTTRYGIRAAENLATAAALAGWTVVSGLARGIDTIAHQATLRVHGRTIAVLGSGLARVYPQQNIELARKITAENGSLVSEFPMTFRPDKRTFPMRNRIISGMTRGCIVVEAGHRSGSLITANQALDQNRQVFAVPGPIDSPQSRGCNALIKEGAKLVENFQDVLEEFACFKALEQPEHLTKKNGKMRRETVNSSAENLQLSPLERKIISFLDHSETAIDALIAELEAPPAKVLAAVVALEMRHLVRQLPGKRVTKNTDLLTG